MSDFLKIDGWKMNHFLFKMVPFQGTFDIFFFEPQNHETFEGFKA